VTLFSKISFFSITLCIFLSASSCKNDKNDVIPDVAVSFSISINDPQFTSLNAFGNTALINKYTNNLGLRAAGFDENGIIIFSWIDYEFYAYDRTCPHDYAENNLSVAVNIDSLSAGGTPSKGVGRYPLKNYRTNFDGVNIFVSNY
jgi:hypothetical protein